MIYFLLLCFDLKGEVENLNLLIIAKEYCYHRNYGYDSFMIQNQLANYSFNNNQELAEKEYQKLYRKYSRKYEGEELNRIIRDRLYKKGLVYEEE